MLAARVVLHLYYEFRILFFSLSYTCLTVVSPVCVGHLSQFMLLKQGQKGLDKTVFGIRGVYDRKGLDLIIFCFLNEFLRHLSLNQELKNPCKAPERS